MDGIMDEGFMDEADGGTLAARLRGAVWRKSRRSNPSGECVEIASLGAGQIAVRNSRYPCGPVLICEREELAALVQAAKCGDLDVLLA